MGPLRGIRILEIAGIGPGPFAAMMLSDMGAEVLRIDRAQSVPEGRPDAPPGDFLGRGRRSAALDLKHPDAVAAALRLVENADVLLEGFRPGVMERLGVGPEVCLERNPGLVYGRMTGWGQEGPHGSQAAGHDINYIALAGALERDRARGREAPIRAAQPGRRLRRRRHAARVRRVLCALLERASLRPGPGRGRRHGRRHCRR